MVRTQVQLTSAQATRLKRVANEEGLSVAAVIRDAVDLYLSRGASEASLRDKAVAAIGGFHSGLSDVAEAHDEHLTDAFS